MSSENKSDNIAFYIFMGLISIGFIGVIVFLIYSIIN